MTLTYCITVCNEFHQFQSLMSILQRYKRPQDSIVVAFDDKGDPAIEEYLRSHSINGEFVWYPITFNNDFAELKNSFFDYVTSDWIFQLDADEIINGSFCANINSLLYMNENMDLIHVPRANTVKGLTEEHIKKWGWRVDEKNYINFPDYQGRIYRNLPGKLKWVGKVHEKIQGDSIVYSYLPPDKDARTFMIGHHKTIERQEKQNNYYDTL